MTSHRSLASIALIGIVFLYLLVACQYARLTPPWQAPDEPAHFNYVRYVGEHGSLPVLQTGDFPSDYLEEIKAERFPPSMSIDPIRYESWQPPLYYLLAALVYRLVYTQPVYSQLLALRLLSVALGAVMIVLADRTARAVAPGKDWLALGAAAFVATLPMHVAVTAAVSNDALAEVWVALLLWQLVRLLRLPDSSTRPWIVLGLTLGLAGLTKVNTFVVAPLILGVAVYRLRSLPAGKRACALARDVLAVGAPAALLMLPWLARNVAVYGVTDPLAFARHDQVVKGQLRTAQWLSQVGVRQAATAFVTTTFHSFWGQFGWMGVPIDLRLYRALWLLTGLCGVGVGLRVRRQWRRYTPAERAGISLLVASVALSVASLLWYNLTFVQHQGRYLFLSIIPLGLLFAMGWREVTSQGRRVPAAVFCLLVAIALVAHGMAGGQAWDHYLPASLVGLAGAFWLSDRLPKGWPRWLYALPYPLLLLLDLACLYLFIVPSLT